MVVVHVKGELEDDQFLHECPSTTPIQELVEHVAEVQNLRSKITLLSLGLRRQLLPSLSPPSERYSDAAVVALERALSEAEAYASKDQVLYKRSLSTYILKDHIRNIEKEVSAFRSLASSSYVLAEFSNVSSDVDLLDKQTIALLWAGNELLRGKFLCDYIGKNEKTKIIITLRSAHTC